MTKTEKKTIVGQYDNTNNTVANEGKEKLSFHQGFYVNVNFFLFMVCSCCARCERVISELVKHLTTYSLPVSVHMILILSHVFFPLRVDCLKMYSLCRHHITCVVTTITSAISNIIYY